MRASVEEFVIAGLMLVVLLVLAWSHYKRSEKEKAWKEVCKPATIVWENGKRSTLRLEDGRVLRSQVVPGEVGEVVMVAEHRIMASDILYADFDCRMP
jgi:hypothetical protein